MAARSDCHGAIGGANVRRRPVGLGIDRHGLETLLVAGAHDAERDLSAIGHEYALHLGWVRACRLAAVRLRRA